MEQRSKEGRGRHRPCEPSRVEDESMRLYLMSSPEQPSTGKSILFSTFSAEQLLFIMSHTSSVLLGTEMVLWPWSQT